MYQEEAICNREIYKNAEINVLKLNFQFQFNNLYILNIHRIHVFLGLQDLDPVRSICVRIRIIPSSSKESKKTLIFTVM
jgi:hypothetical protein